MHDPRRPRRGVAHDPIVHGLSKREKKKKRAKCREFVECLQSTTASRVRLHGRIPPSYPVECDCPPNRAGHAIHTRIARCTYRLAFASAVVISRVTASDGTTPAAAQSNASRPISNAARATTRARASRYFRGLRVETCEPSLVDNDVAAAVVAAHARRRLHAALTSDARAACARRRARGWHGRACANAAASHDVPARNRVFAQTVAPDGRVAVPLTLIRVQAHFDTMHPFTSTLAQSRPQFDSRPQACAHPSVLPPPVAPPLVGAAPPPPAARVG
ncbi:UNVERIFIED_ORG: hypothetical protein J2791_001085 [Burkholderia contaminans]|nr:hypothetical protein [Burkholderia contaminans]